MSFESITMESSEVRKILEGKTKLIIEKLEELEEEKKKRQEYLASESEAEYAAFEEYHAILKKTGEEYEYCYGEMSSSPMKYYRSSEYSSPSMLKKYLKLSKSITKSLDTAGEVMITFSESDMKELTAFKEFNIEECASMWLNIEYKHTRAQRNRLENIKNRKPKPEAPQVVHIVSKNISREESPWVWLVGGLFVMFCLIGMLKSCV